MLWEVSLADATGYHLCCILLGAEDMLAAPRLYAQGKHPAACQALSYGLLLHAIVVEAWSQWSFPLTICTTRSHEIGASCRESL
jgi:hypothetical protein